MLILLLFIIFQLRVSFSSNSDDLRNMAKQLGQDLDDHVQAEPGTVSPLQSFAAAVLIVV